MNVPLRGTRAARVFLCFALGYLLSYALRAINAVIAPSLTGELGLSNADLGLLSSAYLVSFGCMQLPLGIWLDRYGARRTEAALLLVAALGAAVFAVSDSLAGLWIGRALIGIGVSSCLMAAFKAYRQWYPPQQLSRLASWMLVAGTAGALTATLPVAMVLPLIGWRGVFWLVAALALAASAMLFFLLRDVERSFDAPAPISVHDGGYGRIFGSTYFWRMGILSLVNYGTFVALHTLWAGPWMMTVLGKSQTQTAGILFVFNVVLMLAYLVLGSIAPRIAKRAWSTHHLIGIGLASSLIAQAAILFASGEHGWLWWLLLVPGISTITLAQSNVALAFPAALAGRANAALNLQLFIGAFATQWGFGVLADYFTAVGLVPADAFRATLAIALALQAAAFLYFLCSRAQPDRHHH
jgi:predicted MFS family arabinose efflux permease